MSWSNQIISEHVSPRMMSRSAKSLRHLRLWVVRLTGVPGAWALVVAVPFLSSVAPLLLLLLLLLATMVMVPIATTTTTTTTDTTTTTTTTSTDHRMPGVAVPAAAAAWLLRLSQAKSPNGIDHKIRRVQGDAADAADAAAHD